MEGLVGVYISERKSIPVSHQSSMIFTSGRKWPKSICGKFIVCKATAIGLLHIDDAKGHWVVSVDALAAEINSMMEKDEIQQLPITPENKALVFSQKKSKKKKTTSRKDIVVTTPKKQMETAALEAQNCREMIEAGGEAFYFRTFGQKPRHIDVGSRIFYVEDGYMRGFGTVTKIVDGDMQCDTTGHDYDEGYHAIMPAQSWKWINPIPMKGFQGWRYFEKKRVKVVGGWKDPKPAVK